MAFEHEIDGSGGFAYRNRIGTTSIPNDIAAMGRWLFVARPNATGILAYDVGNPAAPVLAGSAATGSLWPWSTTETPMAPMRMPMLVTSG